MNPNNHTQPRRQFIKSTAILGGMAFLPPSVYAQDNSKMQISFWNSEQEKSIIGAYGSWAAELCDTPPALSIRKNGWENTDSWRSKAIAKTRELLSSPHIPNPPKANIDKQYEFDGLQISELSWQLPYGPKTQAILVKPARNKRKLPGVLGLHDHAGNKYFGKRKITKTSADQHPMMVDHQKRYYDGFAWANELAKRGYVVLVPDSFAFASRRVQIDDLPEAMQQRFYNNDTGSTNPEDRVNIERYNRWASDHEHILSKSLFCGGTTWPGVFLAEDQAALDILSAQDDVDPANLGCAGLSGGGLRTVYLGGTDHRIRCAIAVGFMSTWRDFLMYKSYTHTWMTYTPLLPNYLEFPEILGLRAPLPTMVLNNNQDQLFTLEEMQKADDILKEVFSKTNSSEKYKCNFYEGLHKFDRAMQRDAFDWFDRWLKG